MKFLIKVDGNDTPLTKLTLDFTQLPVGVIGEFYIRDPKTGIIIFEESDPDEPVIGIIRGTLKGISSYRKESINLIEIDELD